MGRRPGLSGALRFMFEFLFKYPMPVFSKGKFVLLGAWPGWVLLLLIAACVIGLAVLIWLRLPQAAAKISRWRAGMVWLLQSLLIATVLVLLWQPAITVAELAPQQNVIAVVLDDSRSMAIADSGSDGKATRAAAAPKALGGGDGGEPLGSREVPLGRDGTSHVEPICFGPGGAGIKSLHFSLGPLAGEE